MELDEMKQVWQRVEGLLERQQSLAQRERVDRELKRVRSSLWPLFWGQVCQIVFGVFVILLAVKYWSENLDVWYRMATGLVVHAYGIVTIILAGLTLAKIRGIDYSFPVMTIQKRMAELRSMYVFHGMLVGLPWWLLWIPFMAVIFGLMGADLYLNAPGMVISATLVGIVGLLATWMFHRWAHQRVRAEFGQRLDDHAAGRSLTKARKVLEEVRQFEQE